MNDRPTQIERLRRIADRVPWLGRPMRWLYAWTHLGRHRRELHESFVALLQRLDRIEQGLGRSDLRLDRSEQRLAECEQREGRLEQADGRLGDDIARWVQALQAIESILPRKAEREALPDLERRLLGIFQTVTGDAHRHWDLQHTLLLRQLLERLGGGLAPTAAAVPPDAAPEDFQWALATEFRGSKAAIRTRLEGYVETVRATALRLPDKLLVDLGCGRGEWLELLRDAGLEGVGVDASALAVEECRHNGLAVEQADALGWLRGRPSGEAAVVSGFHIVEHLPTGQLLALLREAWRVLAPGGLLLLETPNPENLLVATRMFHRDPTHRAPLPPELLEFMVRWVGFRDARVLRLSPYPESCRLPGSEPATRALDELLHGPQDYAVLAQAG